MIRENLTYLIHNQVVKDEPFQQSHFLVRDSSLEGYCEKTLVYIAYYTEQKIIHHSDTENIYLYSSVTITLLLFLGRR